MSKLSFQQLLLIAFLSIIAVLSATTVQALFTFERLASQSREVAVQAVQLTEQSERLAERTVAMERSARQYLVLEDLAFRERYLQARLDARGALQALTAAIPTLPSNTVAEWVAQSDAAWQALKSDDPRSAEGQKVLALAFARLPQLNGALALASRREIARRNDDMLDELEHQRQLLGILVFAAIGAAAVAALAFGTWLGRPLARIEAAIERLGENQFDQVIDVGGPADMRRLGQQLNWLRQRLAELESEKTRFLRHISHELKTPLAALCEGVASLEDEVAGKLTADQREVTAILKQNTLSLQNQIEDLLRYNTAAFGAQHLQRSPVDVERLLHRVIHGQRLQCQARNVHIEVSGKPPPVSADADKLAIVLANILTNAVRFSPNGGVIRFMLAEQMLPHRLCLDCVDQGPGVAPEDAARVFDPFYQGVRQPAGARKGNGIGLSIVREYIEAHGGTVRVVQADVPLHNLPYGQDTPPGGAHFRIEIPYDNHAGHAILAS
ncbi:MAG: HAMP domain-containing histidine kinase [Burkholderiaceae bacterium]|nr:HAMP domain-containing histidine kinase [Burkholderiaceae bacterium]